MHERIKSCNSFNQKWSTPNMGFVKINLNAVMDNIKRKIGIDVIERDHGRVRGEKAVGSYLITSGWWL
jgi:hypothetical protein